jgi:hypothetical protein
MRKSIFVTLITCLMLALAATASAQTVRFEGHWKNVDPHTRGLVELVIRVNGPNVEVKAFGVCEPHPCDVGNTEAHAYAPNVGDNLEATARALIAHYHASFAEMVLVIEPRGTNELSAQLYTHFRDNSHRTDFVESGVFRK